MKKYLLGILSIAMAIGFSAFTAKPFKKSKTSEFTFAFTGDPGVQGQVSDLTKWEDVVNFDPGCPGGGSEYACKITVSYAYTHFDAELGCAVLNTPFNNPQSGLILIIPEIFSVFSLYKVDQLTATFEVDNADVE